MLPNPPHCQIWVVDYLLDERPCRWIRAFALDQPVQQLLLAELAELYGGRACLSELRPASEAEQQAYLSGSGAANPFCPLPPDPERP